MTMGQALSDPIFGPSMVLMGLSVVAIVIGLIAGGRQQKSSKFQDWLTYGALIGMIVSLVGMMTGALVSICTILSQMQTI